MEFSYDDNELQEIIKLNGQTVCNALAILKKNATEREISDHISNYTGQPINRVAREVNEILYWAVSNGFLVRNGNTFTLPGEKDIYQVDCDEPDSSSDSASVCASSLDAAEEGNEAACLPVAEAEDPEITDAELNEIREWLDSPQLENDIDIMVDVVIATGNQNSDVSSSSSEDGEPASGDGGHCG